MSRRNRKNGIKLKKLKLEKRMNIETDIVMNEQKSKMKYNTIFN